jgi:hypothetical protein
MLFLCLLRLRIKQAIRFLLHSGMGGFIVAPLIAISLYAISKKVHTYNTTLFYACVAYAVIFIDQSRRDKKFLRKLGAGGYWFIFFEYLLIALALLVPNVAYMGKKIQYLSVLFLMVATLVVFPQTNIKSPVTRWVKAATALIPIGAFEWRFGIRKYFFLFAIVYIGSLLIIPFLPVTPFVLLYFTTFIYEFYKVSDPKEFIQSGDTVAAFIAQKTNTALFFTTLLFLPHFVLFLVFHFHYSHIGILLLAAIITYIALLYAIALKYSTPKDKTAKVLLFFIVSPLIPISVVLLFIEFKKAKCRIANLLPS